MEVREVADSFINRFRPGMSDLPTALVDSANFIRFGRGFFPALENVVPRPEDSLNDFFREIAPSTKVYGAKLTRELVST